VLQIGPVSELVLLLKQLGGGTRAGGRGCGLCRGGESRRYEKRKAKKFHGILPRNGFISTISKLASASRKSRVSELAAFHFSRNSSWRVGPLLMKGLKSETAWELEESDVFKSPDTARNAGR
jgi:hypothetical protein